MFTAKLVVDQGFDGFRVTLTACVLVICSTNYCACRHPTPRHNSPPSQKVECVRPMQLAGMSSIYVYGTSQDIQYITACTVSRFTHNKNLQRTLVKELTVFHPNTALRIRQNSRRAEPDKRATAPRKLFDSSTILKAQQQA